MDKQQLDPWIFSAVLILLGIGIVMVFSSSSIYASEKLGDEAYFVKKHVLFSIIGIILMVGAALIPLKFWWQISYPLLGLVLISLILVACTPLGRNFGGSSRWLKIGGIGYQPAEAAKLALILYLSRSFVRKGEKMGTFKFGFLPHVIMTGIIIGLVLLQPDFGTAVVLAMISMLMMFAGGVRISHLSSLVLSAIPFLYFMVMNVDYRRRRILAFLDPWKHAQDSGFQIIQSFLAFGSGGLFGLGLGKGRQKLFYLPEAHTDFIFSCIGEEMGLIGVLTVVMLFSIIIWRGILTSNRTQDRFGSYLSLGATLLIGLQAVVNMGVVLGLLPTKGLPLPFVSYGGSSLLICLISAGIIMNAARFSTTRSPWEKRGWYTRKVSYAN